MEDACGVSPSLPPSRRRELFTQADLFCFGVEICLFFFFFSFSSFFVPPHLTIISGKAEQGHEKQTSALELDTGTCPRARGSAWGTSNQEHPP